MIPAEELRAAAKRMRELATASLDANGTDWYGPDDMADVLAASLPDNKTEVDAAHIVGWSPAVALAVAAWLDGEAEVCDEIATAGYLLGQPDKALAVARAFLGTTP